MHAGKLKYLEAYRQVLDTQDCIEMWFSKVVFLGASRLGKTTACRRLSGVIKDIRSSGTFSTPSTGIVESGKSVFIKNFSVGSSTTILQPSEWSPTKDYNDEACTLLHYLYDQVLEKKDQNKENLNVPIHKEPPQSESLETMYSVTDEEEEDVSLGAKPFWTKAVSVVKNLEFRVTPLWNDILHDKVEEDVDSRESDDDNDNYSPEESFHHATERTQQPLLLPQVNIMHMEPPEIKRPASWRTGRRSTEIHCMFRKAINSKHWKELQHSLKDMTLLKIDDTGGQPEFMDLLPVFTIGPALYLIFCKLIDNLQSSYMVSYLSSSGESTIPVESLYTMEEVILRALASISCFSSLPCPSEFQDAEAVVNGTSEFNNSIAYIIGTHKDLVTTTQIEDFDKTLQHRIESTDLRRKIVQFSSDERMVLPIDNMTGGEKEMNVLRSLIENGIKQHFKKLSIPASWLLLSLCLRQREEKTVSLRSVLRLSRELSMSFAETKLALWFLHHHAGIIMFFPDMPELRHTIICDTQVVYDSITKLIVNTFKFGPVSGRASERFRRTGQFSLEDIRAATGGVSQDCLPLHKLVRLLEHLHVVAPMIVKEYCFDFDEFQMSLVYFMPCILQSASPRDTELWRDHLSLVCSPAPLLVRYACDYVPIGIFPALIARLVRIVASFQLIPDDIKKNIVQFKYGKDNDIVTLISQPKFYEVHITRSRTAFNPTHRVCVAVRKHVEEALIAVTSRMNYCPSIKHQLAFECPFHHGRDHVSVVIQSEAENEEEEEMPNMLCCPHMTRQLKMKDDQLVWFGKVSVSVKLK